MVQWLHRTTTYIRTLQCADKFWCVEIGVLERNEVVPSVYWNGLGRYACKFIKPAVFPVLGWVCVCAYGVGGGVVFSSGSRGENLCQFLASEVFWMPLF